MPPEPKDAYSASIAAIRPPTKAQTRPTVANGAHDPGITPARSRRARDTRSDGEVREQRARGEHSERGELNDEAPHSQIGGNAGKVDGREIRKIGHRHRRPARHGREARGHKELEDQRRAVPHRSANR